VRFTCPCDDEQVAVQCIIESSHKGENTTNDQDSNQGAAPRIPRSYGQQNKEDDEGTNQTDNNSDAWMVFWRLSYNESKETWKSKAVTNATAGSYCLGWHCES
jgi:hypothetical protein